VIGLQQADSMTRIGDRRIHRHALGARLALRPTRGSSDVRQSFVGIAEFFEVNSILVE
jgi:hypothetical protein